MFTNLNKIVLLFYNHFKKMFALAATDHTLQYSHSIKCIINNANATFFLKSFAPESFDYLFFRKICNLLNQSLTFNIESIEYFVSLVSHVT